MNGDTERMSETIQQENDTIKLNTKLGALNYVQSIDDLQKIAVLYSQSRITPKLFFGNEGACFQIIEIALQLRLNAFFLMQQCKEIKGNIMWTGAFSISLIRNSKKYKKIWWDVEYMKDSKGNIQKNNFGQEKIAWCKFCAIEADDESNSVKESIVYWTTVEAEGWSRNAGQMASKWNTMTLQMFKYRSAAFFARTECPEVLFGFMSEGEADDIEVNMGRSDSGKIGKGSMTLPVKDEKKEQHSPLEDAPKSQAAIDKQNKKINRSVLMHKLEKAEITFDDVKLAFKMPDLKELSDKQVEQLLKDDKFDKLVEIVAENKGKTPAPDEPEHDPYVSADYAEDDAIYQEAMDNEEYPDPSMPPVVSDAPGSDMLL